MVLMLPIFVAARSIQNISKYAMNLNTITVIRGGKAFFRPTLKMSQIMCCVVSGFRTLLWFSDAFSEAVNMFVCTIARRVPFLDRNRIGTESHREYISAVRACAEFSIDIPDMVREFLQHRGPQI